MSATSGIGVSPELTSEFSLAIESKNVRFLKVSIQNESLIHDLSIPVEGTLSDDLTKLSNPDIIQDDVPAYILTKLDEPLAEWLVIYYVPDSAKVRDKMLYASSRNALLRSLGSTIFTDTMFATSKADLTPEAYAAHLRSIAAPKPMSAQEKEMANVRSAERQTGGVTYEASHVRSAPLGWGWAAGVEDALKELDNGDGTGLVVLTLDSSAEKLVLKSATAPTPDELGSSLPQDEPCYAFFAYPHSSKREIVFIYSCPSSSPVKFRMIYSSGCMTTHLLAEPHFTTCALVSRKVETSEPKELDEKYLKMELGLMDENESFKKLDAGGNKPFAKPKGPPRRR